MWFEVAAYFAAELAARELAAAETGCVLWWSLNLRVAALAGVVTEGRIGAHWSGKA